MSGEGSRRESSPGGASAGDPRAPGIPHPSTRGGRGAQLLETLRMQNLRVDADMANVESASVLPSESSSLAGDDPPQPPTVGRGRAAALIRARAQQMSQIAAAATSAGVLGGAHEGIAPDQISVAIRKEEVPTWSPPETESPGPSPRGPAAARGSSDEATTSSSQLSGPMLYRGSGGKKLEATANYIRLSLEEGMGVFEYEVLFNPRMDSRDHRFKLLNQHWAMLGERVFDGVKLFLPSPLPEDKTVCESIHEPTSEKVTLTLKFKGQKRSGDRDVVQLYNILFNKIFRALAMAQHKRNFFDPSAVHVIKQFKLEVWPGYSTAVDMYEGGLLLQIDVAHRVLRTETPKDVLVVLAKRGGDVKTEADKALLGESIVTRYNNKSYRIDEVDFKCSPRSTFTNEKGQEISFVDYYKRQYDIEIKDHDQPMLISKAKKRGQEENVEKLICLVPELCLLTGMTDAMRADFKIMKEVGAFTRVTPENRQRALMQFVENVAKNDKASAHLRAWGLKLERNTLPLDMRVLDPEVIHFGKGYKETVTSKADWGRSATTKCVLTPVPITKWALLFVETNKIVVQNFCKIMQQQGPKMGIPIAMPRIVSLANDRTETYLKALRDLIDPSVQLVMTIVPAIKSDRYAAIKKLCCVEKPIASQVVVVKTINNEKKVMAVAQKVILQLNCKLGGELWACTTPFKDLMVVGIDVFHEKNQRSGSIAGVVASLNHSLSRYYSTVAFQQQGQEMVDALKVSFLECLIKYWEHNHAWPQNIVVFRDGVGDGQLETTQRHEVAQFLRSFQHVASPPGLGEAAKETYKRLGELLPPNYNPGFVFVVVQKRINTRMFQLKRVGEQTVFENPVPGAILDHTVTRYSYKDFFLVPQSVTQGTVSPTHFIVLAENPAANPTQTLTINDVQKLAYKLTHMYFNWPGTVRVPSPCQYAHKLVSLVGEHIHKPPAPQLADKLYYL